MTIKYKNAAWNILFVFAVMFFLNSQCTKAVPPRVHLSPSDYNTGLTWEKAQNLNKPVVLNFYVDWCHFCQGFAPVLDQLRQEYSSKYSFVSVNCDDPKNQALVRKFYIDSYPSLFLVDKNKKIYIDSSKYNNIKQLRQELNKFSK